MLGYAPQSGSGLLAVVQKESISAQDALRLGLIGQKDPQRFYEKFFARLIFPIVNPAGKVVGIWRAGVGSGLAEVPQFQ